MAGEIQLNSTTFATESGGTVTVANVDSATNRTNLGLGSIATQNANAVSVTGGSLTGTEIDLKSSGTTIYASDGTTAVLSESGGTVTLASGVAGTMSRKVYAKLSGNQTVTANTATEVQFLDTESGCFDLDNTFASYRYTPTQSGYYYVNATVTFDLSADTKVSYAYIYKNGSVVEQNRSRAGFDTSNRVDGIIYMNGSTDYLSIYGQHNDTTSKVIRSDLSRILIFFCP